MNTQGAVERQFGAVANAYAASAVHRGGPDLEAMLRAAPASVARMLDLGCGTGHTTLAFAPIVAEAVGYDLTPAMLDQARHLATERGTHNVWFVQGDVGAIEFPDASFDLVTTRYSAHHWPEPARAVGEIVRVLRPGGTLLFVDVVAPDAPALDTMLNAVELLRDPSHVRDHSARQWQRMLEQAGLAATILETFPLRLDFESWTARMQTPPAVAAQIKWLFAGATTEQRTAFNIEDDFSFTIPVALVRGVLPPKSFGA